MTTYNDCLEIKKLAEEQVENYQMILSTFKREKNGLIKYKERIKPEYKDARKCFKQWFKRLQSINRYIHTNFKKEHLKNTLENSLN